MAAPTPTAREAPEYPRLRDGYKSLITFEADPDIALWEMQITPPGIDNGEPVDTFTMHNDVWRTRAPRHLLDLTAGSFVAAYNPKALVSIRALCGVETTITHRFPNGDTYCYYGYLQKAEPQQKQEGQMPTMNCTIMPTNTDPDTGEEEDPVFTEYTGTGADD